MGLIKWFVAYMSRVRAYYLDEQLKGKKSESIFPDRLETNKETRVLIRDDERKVIDIKPEIKDVKRLN